MAVFGLALAGCGGGAGGSSPAGTLSTATPGLSYTLEITAKGKLRCTTATYRTKLPDGRPVIQGSHSCGPAGVLAPLLIQARASRQSMLLDLTPGGCGVVRARRPGAPSHVLVTRCTATPPRYRVTILPSVRRLLLEGVPGIPTIYFPRHRCTTSICVTPLR